MAEPATDSGRTFLDILADGVEEGIVTTFSSICGSARAGEREAWWNTEDSVIGIISFTGEVPLTVNIGFPRKSAEQITRKFTGMEFDYNSPEMGDLIGELANVFAGDLIVCLERARISVKMSLPTVARGQARIVPMGGQTTVDFQFSTPSGDFWAMLCTMKSVALIKR